jgi:hypothetical protein
MIQPTENAPAGFGALPQERKLNFVMLHIAFDVNGSQRSCGANVFAGAASDASFGIDGRDFTFFAAWGGGYDKRDSAVWASAAASAAVFTFGGAQADIFIPDGAANLEAGFLLDGDGLNGAGGAYG